MAQGHAMIRTELNTKKGFRRVYSIPIGKSRAGRRKDKDSKKLTDPIGDAMSVPHKFIVIFLIPETRKITVTCQTRHDILKTGSKMASAGKDCFPRFFLDFIRLPRHKTVIQLRLPTFD